MPRHRDRVRAARLFALLLSAGSCQEGSTAGVTHFQVDTLLSGGIRVTNDGEGVWTDKTAWRLEADLVLGSRDGPGANLFSQIAFIETDQDDRIYVLDYQAQDIRVFEPSGEFAHRIGGPGAGPGEFLRAAGLSWGPQGYLWVWGGRYSVFDGSGDFVTSYGRLVRGSIYPWLGGFTPDGRFIDWGIEREILSTEVVGQRMLANFSGYTAMHPIAFTPPDHIDSLPPIEYQAAVTATGQLKTPPNGVVVSQASDGNLWLANTDEYLVFKRTLGGDTLLSFSVPSVPMPVPSTEIDSIVQARSRAGDPVERERFAAYRQLVTRVIADNAGHVYVLPQEDGLTEGEAIDVFNDSGVYLGRMAFPRRVLTRAPRPHITSSHIYAVIQDEYDVPYVVRFRIVRP